MRLVLHCGLQPNSLCFTTQRSGCFLFVPQSGHPLFMGARGPRDDGFRCGSWINLDLSIGVASLMESTGAADDDLSWWSVIFEKFKNRKEKGTNAGTSA